MNLLYDFNKAIKNNDIKLLSSTLSKKEFYIKKSYYNKSISKAFKLKHLNLVQYLVSRDTFVKTDQHIGFIIFSKKLCGYEYVIDLLFNEHNAEKYIEKYNLELFKKLTKIKIHNKIQKF